MTLRFPHAHKGDPLDLESGAYVVPDTTLGDMAGSALAAQDVNAWDVSYEQPETGFAALGLANGVPLSGAPVLLNTLGGSNGGLSVFPLGISLGDPGAYFHRGDVGALADGKAAGSLAACGQGSGGGSGPALVEGAGQSRATSIRYGVDLTRSDRLSVLAPANSAWGGSSKLTPVSAGNSTLSSPQLVDFQGKGAVALGGGFSYSLPSFLYQSKSYSYGVGVDGFSVNANVSVAGGIKGGITCAAASIIPDFPLEMNPEVLNYVQQSQTFSIDPTLISTEDAGFGLNLPSLSANLKFGLTANASVSLAFPSVSVGFSIFGHFIGVTFDGPTISYSESAGQIVSLPDSASKSFPGATRPLRNSPPKRFSRRW